MNGVAMNTIIHGDCLEAMRGMADNSVDLVFGSPPYEAARTYGIGFKLRGQEWVDWMVERIVEMVRICKGLVAMVVEGQTKNYQWTATPSLLMADLHRRGIKLRKPPIYARVGIPGSGGPDWLRNDYEFVVCASNGRLPWSHNTAMGHPPKYAPGVAPSHRMPDGSRVNDPWMKRGRGNNLSGRKRNGEKLLGNGNCHRKHEDGIRGEKRGTAPRYNGVAIANPGNIVKCVVGGGMIGSKLAHENEAPFPERLAEFFVRSFCPPGGIVLDPFSGSGTTAAVAVKTGRNYMAIDCRESQCELTKRRLDSIQRSLFT